MIDWDRVNTLRDEVGAEDFEEVVDLFLCEVEEVTSRLSREHDVATIEADLHFLKGGALNLGFVHFSDLCQVGENLAANGRADQVDISEILDSYTDSKKQFIGTLSEAFAA